MSGVNLPLHTDCFKVNVFRVIYFTNLHTFCFQLKMIPNEENGGGDDVKQVPETT